MKKDFNAVEIEKIISNMIETKNIDGNLDNLKRKINRISNPHECDEILVNKDERKLFIMSIYPYKKNLYNMASELEYEGINRATFNNYKYIIEIDYKLFDKSYNFTAGEITAILLHEIGHVQHIESDYAKIKEIYMYALSKQMIESDKGKLLELTNPNTEIKKLYVIDALDRLSIPHLVMKNSVEAERLADSYAISLGYKDELISSLDKVKKNCTRIYDDDITNALNYAQLLALTNSRQNYIKRMLKQQEKTSTSKYLKNVLEDINKNLDKLTKFTDKTSLNKRLDTILDESFIQDMMFNINKVSKKDIDEMNIEFEMIETYNDKMALMYKIHRRLIQIESSKENCDDKQKLALLKLYEKQLLTLLDKLMKHKIVEKEYGVFIKYPKGYQG